MSRNTPRLPLKEEILRPSFRRERKAFKAGIWPVAGCDEAGRGPLAGPVVGASIFTWLSDLIAREFAYWRAALGATILLIVLAFPLGIAGSVRRLFEGRQA